MASLQFQGSQALGLRKRELDYRRGSKLTWDNGYQ